MANDQNNHHYPTNHRAPTNHQHEQSQTSTQSQIISRKLQQGLADWNPNPLVPKAFQQPVESQALAEAIEDIAALARAPLEEMICQQQAQIQTQMHKFQTQMHKFQAQMHEFQAQMHELEQALQKPG